MIFMPHLILLPNLSYIPLFPYHFKYCYAYLLIYIYFIYLIDFNYFYTFIYYFMHSGSSSGCLAGSSPALSIGARDRCRCDFSTRSDEYLFLFLFYDVYSFVFFFFMIRFYSLSAALLIVTGSSVNTTFISVYASLGFRVIVVNKQSSINLHLNLKKKEKKRFIRIDRCRPPI